MRIISGTYKGKIIYGEHLVGTRPTMDRVKESLFAILNPFLKDATVLDLFAGSGSLGLEAISNGAKTCYLVDHNPKVIETIKKTITNMSVTEHIVLMKIDYRTALKQFQGKEQFDLIFLDPPYQEKQLQSSINLIEKYQLLKKDGLLICEHEQEPITSSCYTIYKEKKYGSKKITIYQFLEKK